MSKLGVVILLLLTVLVGQTAAQSELDRLADRIKSAVQIDEPGWTCTTGEPMSHSSGVLVLACSVQRRRVSISILEHNAVQEAQQSMHKFKSLERESKQLDNLGEEAWGWGMDAADIALRKGRFTVFISASARVEKDPDAATLTRDQKEARRQAERLRLTPEFAKYVVSAIDR